jgi:hypothetical protein
VLSGSAYGFDSPLRLVSQRAELFAANGSARGHRNSDLGDPLAQARARSHPTASTGWRSWPRRLLGPTASLSVEPPDDEMDGPGGRGPTKDGRPAMPQLQAGKPGAWACKVGALGGTAAR